MNEDPKDTMLRQFQEEIAKLKSMLEGDVQIDPITVRRGRQHALRGPTF